MQAFQVGSPGSAANLSDYTDDPDDQGFTAKLIVRSGGVRTARQDANGGVWVFTHNSKNWRSQNVVGGGLALTELNINASYIPPKSEMATIKKVRITFIRNGLRNILPIQRRISIIRKVGGVNHSFRLPVIKIAGTPFNRKSAFPGYDRTGFGIRNSDSLHSGDYSVSPNGAMPAYVNISQQIDKTPGFLQQPTPPNRIRWVFGAEIERVDGTRKFESFIMFKANWKSVPGSPFSNVGFRITKTAISSSMFMEAWGKFESEL